MTIRILIAVLFSALIFNGCKCTKEYECGDPPIYPAFIGFSAADIDTFVVRKYQPNTNYQNLVDTFVIKYSDYYRTSNDTTKVILYLKGDQGIKPGFDWQVFIPAVQKTVFVSDIRGNKKTTECGALAAPSNCGCANDLFSAKQDNQIITFTDTDRQPPFIYIRK